MKKIILRKYRDYRKEITKEELETLEKYDFFEDMVIIKYYCEHEIWERKDAIMFYHECVCACEGSELDRMTNVYCALTCGDKICKGE